MKKYSGVTCRGCMQLGNGCGKCEKCSDQLVEMYDRGEIVKAKPEQKVVGMPGWICPVCGRGNAPHSNNCPCIPIPAPVVTC